MGYSEICFRIARGGRQRGEPAMILVRFKYLRSDSERKLLIGQFNLTHVKQESPDMLENRPRLPTGHGGIFIC